MIKPLLLFIFVTFTTSFSSASWAKDIFVAASDDLQTAFDLALDGDVVAISAGKYKGNFIVRRAIRVIGEKGVVLNANNSGHGLELQNSNITIENLTIVNWGRNLTTQDSGIYTDVGSTNLTLRNNVLKGDGFGIWVQKSDGVLLENNHITGNSTLRSADRGNGIQLSMVKNALVEGNTVNDTRDGLYIISSQQNVLKNNTMHDLRYGIHYMYSHNNQVLNNFAYNTRAGYALMSSRNLIVSGNRTVNSEDYGFLMNFITSSEISYNQIKQVWTKAENKVLGRDGKGLFIYNSAYNKIMYNTIDTAEIGVHLTAGSENTKVYGNNFINNPVQIKYVSNKQQEWSLDGIGNYWSNYLGWDLNNDGTGDTAFVPNDGIDKMVWQYPEAKVLLDSPAVLLLRWVQNQFPVLKPGGVKDSFPLMQPFPVASNSHSKNNEVALAL
ncbi:MAG: nitrous oxide reductase family maturation protein NosD [Moritella sp.]|uniref:nitrous oxide reductase family maturation protein NosD n=1 Tax=Moritella sp. TaxID=78556 RepID=UPI0029A8D4F3|nr:nitrous oxide reductase family maturation protein NosD [Moritella sp.]MDX2320832.1 nitrous oxide reductase family maturation protein NosD [Moritella sp.]